MKIKFLSKLILFCLLFTSCIDKNANIGFRKIGSEAVQFGHTNGAYKIGDSINFSKVDTAGIHIEFIQDRIKSFSISNSDVYELSNGIRIGSTKKEIRKVMGKPIRDEIKINKGSRQIGGIDAMIYKNVKILMLDGSTATIITLENSI